MYEAEVGGAEDLETIGVVGTMANDKSLHGMVSDRQFIFLIWVVL